MSFNLADYTTVAERIKLFWEKYPDGAVRTMALPSDANVFVMRCELYRNVTDTVPFSTGHAREVAADKGVNRDFPLENCETSSIGIACKNAGIGTDKNGPSREEMAKVERVQNRETLTDEGYTPYQIGRMAAMSEANPADPEPHCKHGAMQLRKGISEKTGKNYYGFVCISPDKVEQCPADWWELGPMANGAKRWQNMAEMHMSDNKGNHIVYEQDGSVSVPGLRAFCDKCEKTMPERGGKVITDATGQVIMWFCFHCRLQTYIK